jgi:5'-3' exonuclease
MGIPAYFSYIIKNHQRIIHEKIPSNIDSLYMDCNSIIYDAVRIVEQQKDNSGENNDNIIVQVIKSIEYYIQLIKPTKIVYIAFDGVAPFAKMQQQKTRRYKTEYITRTTTPDSNINKFSTLEITPGTIFMNKLSKCIKHHFHELNSTISIIISTSEDPGEGEHKLFEHMRQYPNQEESIVIYGLDSDLIMLAIFHYTLFKNVYICREAPEFNLDITKSKSNDLLFMDIELLSNSILIEMGASTKRHVDDYVFVCFMLGNDFLPHFPALNIRTHGIQRLLDVYKIHISNYKERYLVDVEKNKINWRHMNRFIQELAKNEHEWILQEYKIRERERFFPEITPEQKEYAFQCIPMVYRGEERYICPTESFWEDRYYKILFHDKTENKIQNKDKIREICINYIEGLEWTFKYYTVGCKDWKWKYNYHYPPLLKDLLLYVPHFDMIFIDKIRPAFTPEEQLLYVLPNNQEQTDVKFQWAFCKYFWEAHLIEL